MNIEERFDRLEARIAELADLLRAAQMQQQPPPAPTPGEVVSLDDAARYLGIRSRTLRDRKGGTAGIPRYRDRPVQFLRASLDQFKRARVEDAARRGQEPTRRLSLIRRRKSA